MKRRRSQSRKPDPVESPKGPIAPTGKDAPAAPAGAPVKKKKLSKREQAALNQAAQKERRKSARAIAATAPAAPPPPVSCSEEEIRFSIEYLKDLNGAAAIVRAGIHDDPKVAKVYASRYLDREHVILELARRRGNLIGKRELTLERINEELWRLGMANLSDVCEWDGETLWLNPKAELSDEQLSAIAEIEEIPGMYGTRLAIKMHDKKGALVALQKHLAPSPAENRFNGGAGDGKGVATIVLEGGPTGLEVTVSVKPAERAEESDDD